MNAIRNRHEVAKGSFEQVAPLAEAVTLASIALRVPYKRLLWDAAEDGVHQFAGSEGACPPRTVSSGVGRAVYLGLSKLVKARRSPSRSSRPGRAPSRPSSSVMIAALSSASRRDHVRGFHFEELAAVCGIHQAIDVNVELRAAIGDQPAATIFLDVALARWFEILAIEPRRVRRRREETRSEQQHAPNAASREVPSV